MTDIIITEAELAAASAHIGGPDRDGDYEITVAGEALYVGPGSCWATPGDRRELAAAILAVDVCIAERDTRAARSAMLALVETERDKLLAELGYVPVAPTPAIGQEVTVEGLLALPAGTRAVDRDRDVHVVVLGGTKIVRWHYEDVDRDSDDWSADDLYAPAELIDYGPYTVVAVAA